MRLIKPNTSINFVGYGKYALVFSVLLVLVSFASFSLERLTFGVDFTGGVVVEAGYPDPVELNAVRGALAEGGYPDATVQHFGASDADFGNITVFVMANSLPPPPEVDFLGFRTLSIFAIEKHFV